MIFSYVKQSPLPSGQVRGGKLLLLLTFLFIYLGALAQAPTRNFVRQSGPQNNKIALVIGNNAYYGSNRLYYAVEDAQRMRDAFQEQGYDILEGYDLNVTNFKALIQEFVRMVPKYKQCVVYYAGHAFEQFGTNYLLPIRANPTEENLSKVTIILEEILAEVSDVSIPKLLIMDACRSAFRSGFTPEEAHTVRIRKNTLIIYTTVAGARVWDNNPFTEEFSEEMKRGGCIEQVFKDVSTRILEGNPNQLIYQEGSLQGDICFEEKEVDNMVFVKGGWFDMGCTDEQGEECQSDEKPVHPVKVDDFYIGATEVTVGQFEQFIKSTNYPTTADEEGWSWIYNGSDWEKKTGVNWRCGVDGRVRGQGEKDHPVIHVSWHDAVAYCAWKSKRHPGRTYRLPTEAEWEYAARGGQKATGTKYAGSNDLSRVGWYRDNANKNTHPVRTKQPNSLGLYDMSGNVWEWCSDWYGDYSSSSQQNPTGPASGSSRVLRGGSWLINARHCRVSNRFSYGPDYRDFIVGFRVVSSPVQ